MDDGRVDEYIAAFEHLAHHTNARLDDPANPQTFARGLPRKLAEARIDIESSSNFIQWARAAQRQHRNWLKKKSVHDDDDTVVSTVSKSQPKSTKKWGWQRT